MSNIPTEHVGDASTAAPKAEGTPRGSSPGLREQILEDLVTEARYFVSEYHPQSQEEETAQRILLEKIDEALPLPKLADACEKDLNCFQANGHEGECDVRM